MSLARISELPMVPRVAAAVIATLASAAVALAPTSHTVMHQRDDRPWLGRIPDDDPDGD